MLGHQMRRHAVLLAGFALALAACASDDKQSVDPNIVPVNYKQEILDTMSRTLVDPTNVRDAYVSEPALAAFNKEQRYTACVRYNARNESRQYMGSKERLAYFYGGHLNQLVEANKEQCGKAAYKPFPELEKLCLAKACD
jgi:ABC-type Fe3+-hydroxamate transport system substrate-binding protein